MSSQRGKAEGKAGGKAEGKAGKHIHVYNLPFPSDPRFTRCACGRAERSDRISENPGVRWWGFGPKGATCGDCARLVRVTQSRTWYKCRERDDLTRSARTDQRLGWEACGRFRARAGDIEEVFTR